MRRPRRVALTGMARALSTRSVLLAVSVLCAGVAGGFLFRLLHLPLPWTLGAMFSAAWLSFFRPAAVLPAVFRDGARPVIGVMAGSAFTPAIVAGMTGQWPVLLLLVGFFVVTTSLGMAFFRSRGLETRTALLASMPGGLGEMTLLGAQFGADVRVLVLIHSVRIVMVVTMIPFAVSLLIGHALVRGGPPAAHAGASLLGMQGGLLVGCTVAGYLLGRVVRSFGGLMLVPLLLSAVLHATGVLTVSPPYWIVAGMQVVIGCISGARFAGVTLAEARRLLGMAVLWAALLIGTAVLVAILAARGFGLPAMGLFLALAPGGFAEMSVIAVATGIETGFVIACHTFRVLYIYLTSPMLSRWLLRE